MEESLSGNSPDFTEELYADLRRLAIGRLTDEYATPKMDVDSLIVETWLRLGGDHQPPWVNRAQFFSAAAEAMRRILIEKARFRKALRHGGKFVKVELINGVEGIPEITDSAAGDKLLIALHEALDELEEIAPEIAEIVKLRYFVGLTIKEIAETVSLSTRTVNRRLKFARNWLEREISKE